MRIASFVLAIVALAMSAGAAYAKSPVQVTPDGSIILVNKQLGTGATAQQWVMSLDIDVDTLTGNVFETSGAPATFFSCDVTWSGDGIFDLTDLSSQTATFDCLVASGCSALPCDPDVEWHALGSTPSLPGTFFLP